MAARHRLNLHRIGHPAITPAPPQLDDIDWRAGKIAVTGTRSPTARLPLQLRHAAARKRPGHTSNNNSRSRKIEARRGLG